MIKALFNKLFKRDGVKVSKAGDDTSATGRHPGRIIEAPAGVRIVPPVGSEITLGGFRYRVRKVTTKDLILRPIANA